MIWYYICSCITTIILVAMFRPRCRHIWKSVGDEHAIINKSSGCDLRQSVQIVICENCGKMIRVNITTGDVTTLCSGGTPVGNTMKL